MDNYSLPNGRPNEEAFKEKRGFSGSTIKIFAMITMLIDHTAAVVLQRIISAAQNSNTIADDSALYSIYILMRSIGRLAFPIFCFLLVEGFLHTRNEKKYALRLAAFALISEIPFDLALFGKINFGYQNVFFTLLIGLLVMMGFKYISENAADKKWLTIVALIGAVVFGSAISYALINLINKIYESTSNSSGNTLIPTGVPGVIAAFGFSAVVFVIYFSISKKKSKQEAVIKFADLGILAAGILLADKLLTDYSGFGVLTIAVMYGLRRNHFKSMLGGCITLNLMSVGEFPCFLDLILISRYNGKRGLNMKYLFYAFYPVHLFILYLICFFMKLV